MSELSPGQLIAGKYRIEAVIGQGGMAQVVSAVHTELEQRVAIKTLLPDHAVSQTTVNRFLREAKAAAKIRSEHVARVFDTGRLEHGAPYMVLELLDGTDLAKWVEDNGPMPVRDAVDAVIQACDAIAQAHAIGIVHRDLKPSNLFFTTKPDGTRLVKVIDFGISKQITLDASMTGTAEVFGSPQYMSPEQIRASRDVDGRTDIWALGVVLYELLTGEPPFTAESVLLLGGVILGQEPRPLKEFRDDVPAIVEATMQKCLRKNPDDRFATAVEIAEALVPFASDHVKALVGSMPRLAAAAPISSQDPFKQSDPNLALPVPSSSSGPRSFPLSPPSSGRSPPSSGRRVVVSREPSHADTLGAAATQSNTGDIAPKRGLATPLGAGLAAAGITLVLGAVGLIVYVARTPSMGAEIPSATAAANAPPSASTSLPVLTSAAPPPPSAVASVDPAPSSQPSARASATVRTPSVTAPLSTRPRNPTGTAPPSVPPTAPIVANPATTPSPTATPAPTVIRDRHGGN